MVYAKPLPSYDNVNRPYWDAAREHEFVLQKCHACGDVQFPPAGVCHSCLSDDLEWVKASGRGKVWSFNVFHQVYWESFRPEIPYNVAWIELAEGPMIISNLVGIKNEEIRVDMPVEVVFEEITEQWTLPKFRPAK